MIMRKVLVILVSLVMLLGCKTIKSSVNEKTDTSDSVRIEYKERIVKVPVYVEVEVPVEKVSTQTKDSTSHLETSFAISDASMVWIDGVAFLRHTLANKAQKIQKDDSVSVVEKEKVVYQTRRVTYTKTEIREKAAPWYQKVFMWIGVVSFIIIVIIGLLYGLRR